MTNHRNRRRWAADQKSRARVRFADGWIADWQRREAERLDGLRQLATGLENLPHMAGTLAKVRAEIARLEATEVN